MPIKWRSPEPAVGGDENTSETTTPGPDDDVEGHAIKIRPYTDPAGDDAEGQGVTEATGTDDAEVDASGPGPDAGIRPRF